MDGLLSIKYTLDFKDIVLKNVKHTDYMLKYSRYIGANTTQDY